MRLDFQILQHVYLNVMRLFTASLELKSSCNDRIMPVYKNIIPLITILRIIKISSFTGSVIEVSFF
jgi:hypothetical protein